MAYFPDKTQTHCCTRLQNSENCATLRHAGISILAALTTIALIGGVLLILARQGYPLGGLNAFSQTIPLQWIYFGLGLGIGGGIITSLFIGVQIHHYIKKDSIV